MAELLNKTMGEIWESNYIVPLYQRNFAWGQEQIDQLLQDIYDSFKNCDQEQDRNYYVGSLVVVPRADGTYEVIDGQQRLTVLSLICRKLGILNVSHLRYDSRLEVIKFFEDLFDLEWDEYIKGHNKKGGEKIAGLLDAVYFVENSKIYVNSRDRKSINDIIEENPQFAQYVNENVILVRTVLPADTDVAAYFEIMNNRGEQLQEHEIVKALMMKDLNKEEKNIFSVVWDACSQMNVPIQASFTINERRSLFGGNFDSLYLEELENIINEEGSTVGETIESILAEGDGVGIGEKEEYVDERYESIIDFPNFLMYVFKMIMENEENGTSEMGVGGTALAEKDDSERVPLNADKLLLTYNEYEKTKVPMDFIKRLLKCRVLFDRYVIKNQGGEDDVENVRWILKRPYCYNGVLKYKNTFSNREDTEEADDTEEDTDMKNPNSQARIMKQQSMLQVTFRQRKYKNWLFEFLKWMMESFDVKINDGEIIESLDKWIGSYYDDTLSKNRGQEKNLDLFSAGVNTPHFLFNFIDYLYWVAHIEKVHDIENIDVVDNFDFKYYNSVEHHLPQSYKDNSEYVDNIGNLCLVSRGTNSSLNDKGPTEKAKIVEGLSPKRRIMYKITTDMKVWEEKQIKEHGKSIKGLLSKYKEILGIHG